MSKLSRVRVVGPLAPHAPGFRRDLAGRGYSPHTAADLMYLLAHLSRWLGERGLDAGDLTAGRVERFLCDRTAAGYVHHLTPRALRPLLGYLGRIGTLPKAEATETVPGAIDALVAELATFLAGERGLAVRTVEKYTEITRRFLAFRGAGPHADGLALAELSAGELDAFLLAESTRLGARSLRGVVTGLRALLRFLAVKGVVAPGLAATLPVAPGWRRGSAGRVLDRGEVARLLAGCDRRRAAGRRDYAMLVLMVRLGLRANEVAALRLADVDWRGGEILVSGKGGRRERLPLPVDVGRAVADYCRRGRPHSGERALFLHARAPYGPISRTGVGEIVRRACRRAGLGPVGAHRLRHTAATAMRRGGAPLGEIAQVLRHRNHVTTTVYVNVAAEELRPLTREWPGAVA
jgi:integrase